MFPVVKDHCPEDNKGLALLPLKSFRVFVFFRTATSVGGAKEDRTPDLLRAKQALSQLSYGPQTRYFRVVLRCLYARFRLCTSVHALYRFTAALPNSQIPSFLCRGGRAASSYFGWSEWI